MALETNDPCPGTDKSCLLLKFSKGCFVKWAPGIFDGFLVCFWWGFLVGEQQLCPLSRIPRMILYWWLRKPNGRLAILPQTVTDLYTKSQLDPCNTFKHERGIERTRTWCIAMTLLTVLKKEDCQVGANLNVKSHGDGMGLKCRKPLFKSAKAMHLA